MAFDKFFGFNLTQRATLIRLLYDLTNATIDAQAAIIAALEARVTALENP